MTGRPQDDDYRARQAAFARQMEAEALHLAATTDLPWLRLERTARAAEFRRIAEVYEAGGNPSS